MLVFNRSGPKIEYRPLPSKLAVVYLNDRNMKILNNFLPKNMGDAHEVTRDLEARYDGQLEVLISC